MGAFTKFRKAKLTFAVTASVNYWLVYWPLEPEFAGSNPAEAVGFFDIRKILSMPSFGGAVK
jgi:hypothetical protein